ncbi:META domain-containing protein [Psychroserpens sp. XS_ASV72]|uniref:META domain-containing protein n=1 Tax=Psychroserpens sp. XS_ASV72 TaxID=3241293 RepID=UPI003512F117
MKYLAIIISVFVLKSCGSTQDVAAVSNSQSMTNNQTLSGEFKVKSLEDFNIEKPLTLNFDTEKNSVSGFSGCNRFVGSYEAKGNSISFSQIAVTKMLCQDEANSIEQAFLEKLSKINAFEFSDHGLKLLNDKDVLLQAQSEILERSIQTEDLSISYKATTRGFFEQIWVEGSQLKVTNDRSLNEVSTYDIPEDMLEELKTAYAQLDVKTIPSFEPPSKKFAYDGAAMATLEVQSEDASYVSNIFDHGNPPKAFEELVNILLSIKEKMVKP